MNGPWLPLKELENREIALGGNEPKTGPPGKAIPIARPRMRSDNPATWGAIAGRTPEKKNLEGKTIGKREGRHLLIGQRTDAQPELARCREGSMGRLGKKAQEKTPKKLVDPIGPGGEKLITKKKRNFEEEKKETNVPDPGHGNPPSLPFQKELADPKNKGKEAKEEGDKAEFPQRGS